MCGGRRKKKKEEKKDPTCTHYRTPCHPRYDIPPCHLGITVVRVAPAHHALPHYRATTAHRAFVPHTTCLFAPCLFRICRPPAIPHCAPPHSCHTTALHTPLALPYAHHAHHYHPPAFYLLALQCRQQFTPHYWHCASRALHCMFLI